MPENFTDGFSAFIFDLDGTLLDSMGVWDKIDRLWLSQNGHIPDDELLATFKSMDFKSAAEFSKNKLGIERKGTVLLRRRSKG